jgi:Putative restriction endonuclease
MTQAPLTARRWKRVEYERLVDLGVFEGEPLELIRTQQPVSLDDESEPEPDLAVVPGPPRDYRYAHPERPTLAIEVADSSLEFDRQQKGSRRPARLRVQSDRGCRSPAVTAPAHIAPSARSAAMSVLE